MCVCACGAYAYLEVVFQHVKEPFCHFRRCKVMAIKKATEVIFHRRLVCESFSESFGGLREFLAILAQKRPNLREFARVFRYF